MKITKSRLTQLIREELEGLLTEQDRWLGGEPPWSRKNIGKAVQNVGTSARKAYDFVTQSDADEPPLPDMPDRQLQMPKSTLTPKEFVKSAPKRDDGRAIAVKINKRKSELDEQGTGDAGGFMGSTGDAGGQMKKQTSGAGAAHSIPGTASTKAFRVMKWPEKTMDIKDIKPSKAGVRSTVDDIRTAADDADFPEHAESYKRDDDDPGGKEQEGRDRAEKEEAVDHIAHKAGLADGKAGRARKTEAPETWSEVAKQWLTAYNSAYNKARRSKKAKKS